MRRSTDERPVLVVDDDEGLRLLLVDALRDHGYKAVGVGSGREALANLKEAPSSLMVLDLRLNDMNGDEVLAALKQAGLNVPFVVVTGQGSESVAVEMMKKGALDYVMKESSILDQLPPIIERALQAVEREESLSKANQERSRLEREVLAISEAERQRFRADLHDGLGQQLTALEMICVSLKADVARVKPALSDQLEVIAGALRKAIAETRTIAKGLAPLDEGKDALQTGLAELAEQISATGKIRCEFENLSNEAPADRAVAGHLYRIAQEAVHNAVKHSRGKRVRIKWERSGDEYRLLVEDDGKGLIDGDGTGQGLNLMQYRADMIQGTLTISPRRGGGLSIECRLPI